MKRRPMRLLVSEIHPVNLLLFWLLSFFMKVEAYRVHRMCPRILCRKIEVVDLSQHLSWNDTHCFHSHVMRLWEGLVEKFPGKHWTLRYCGQPLDFSTKAKQELAPYFERLMFLREVRRRREPASRVYIIDSLQFRYLKRLDPSADFFTYSSLAVISHLNVALDSLFAYLYNLAHLLLLLRPMLYGCLHRDRRHLRHTGGIPHIWDSADPGELTTDPNRRFFPWIVDGKHIGQEEVLFILPQDANRKARPDLHSSSYQAFTIPELYRLIPNRILLGCVRDLFVFMARYIVLAPKSLASIRKADYFARIMRLKPLVQHFGPACYVTSLSRMGNEDPATVYLNSIGVKTVMYSYAANGYLFGNGDCTCDFRDVYYAHILASRLVVWHKDFEEFIQRHPQEKLKIEAIGPLMSGEESVFESPPDLLRTTMGIRPPNDRDGLRYISCFDVAAKSTAFKLSNPFYPSPYTEEYSLAFLRDMMRLLEDFDNLALVFKPKRNLVGPTSSYASEFHDLLARLRNSGRGFVLDDDINPWVSIAVADLCIGMPFTSPVLAGMHYGIPGLFHDPTGVALHHRYQPITHYITHEYDQLRSKVRSLIFDNAQYNGDKEVIWSEARAFIGEYPGTNSSDRFRKFLSESRHQEVGV